jgi:GntR family histidine utilization transcriptional repressor|tara:strand:+ start:1000 stop:1722 length:723 start_codon:yes stop_codon:yes gene_type:complete
MILFMINTIKLPQFEVIKQYVRGHIKSGHWPVGTRTPSENELSASFSVSRMTARRALQELAQEGLLTRAPGLGSFVAQPVAAQPTIELHNIIALAQSKGAYSCQILGLEQIPADAELAHLLSFDVDQPVYRGIFVHFDGDKAVQWQEIFVNPAVAPAFLKQKFVKVVPDEYLEWIAPSDQVDSQVSAVLAKPSQRRALGLTEDNQSACLQVTRTCKRYSSLVSSSTLVHPAHLYQLGTTL